jgi:hypothetical protein
MRGQHAAAMSMYEQFITDERLQKVDRMLAAVWAGRAHSKLGNPGSQSRAIALLSSTAADFERLSESTFWAFAQQKLALAYRAAGDLTQAQRHIEIARRSSSTSSPLQQVRLRTAQAHVLSADPRTREEGLRILSQASALAARTGLGHQLDSIRRLQAELDERSSGRLLLVDSRRTEPRVP